MSKADTLLKKATSFEKLAVYSDRKSFIRAIAQSGFSQEEVNQYNGLDELGNPKQNGIPPVDQEVGGFSPNPDVVPYGTPVSSMMDRKPVAPASIDKSVQKALNDISESTGRFYPIKVDGLLGKDTRTAIELFKSERSIPKNTPDVKVFQYIKTVADALKTQNSMMGSLNTPSTVNKT